MSPLAFTASIPLGARPALPGATSSPTLPRPTATPSRGVRMATPVVTKAADKFMHGSQTREAKQAATPFGEYTPQCTEGTGGSNTAEPTRLASLGAAFRLRQTAASPRYADLFATRRAAIIAAAGSHAQEQYAIAFPARAAAGVLGRAERLRACSRYFKKENDPVAEYMFQCVERQYKAMNVVGGVYGTGCMDGRVSGEAENKRVAALATEFRAGTMGDGAQAQMRYNASLEAVFSGRGCDYEEREFLQYPKMAGAVRWGTGAYAAAVLGVDGVMGRKMTVAEQVKGINADSYWPSSQIRPAVKSKSKAWMPSPIKSYAPMSEAAVEFGVKAQTERFEGSPYAGWSAGWKPKSTLGY